MQKNNTVDSIKNVLDQNRYIGFSSTKHKTISLWPLF